MCASSVHHYVWLHPCLPMQAQKQLKANEGLDAYTDATPLRLLPCDQACKQAKVMLAHILVCQSYCTPGWSLLHIASPLAVLVLCPDVDKDCAACGCCVAKKVFTFSKVPAFVSTRLPTSFLQQFSFWPCGISAARENMQLKQRGNKAVETNFTPSLCNPAEQARVAVFIQAGDSSCNVLSFLA